MARIVADRVLETSTTTGTGSYTLDGAVLGYRAASAVCANGDTITYYAEAVNVNGVANGDWEIGIGTWETGGILARTTIVASSNSNAAVSWTTGTRRIGLGVISTPSFGNTTLTGYVDATPITAPTWVEGRVFYDTDTHTLNYYNDNNHMSVNIGQEQIVRVRNTTGSTIPDGSVVYVSGATGQTPLITLAIATSSATSDIIGVTTTPMLNNEFGYVTVNGIVNGLNTVAFADGAAVYVSATVAGEYSTVSPDYPNYSVQVGIVLHSHTTLGKLLVAPQLLSTDAVHVVGTLAVAQGGTGVTTSTGTGSVVRATSPTVSGLTANGTTTLDTALTGVPKLTAGVLSIATPGTDFASATQGANADVYRVDQDTYGFLNQTETTISFVDGTSTFTLAPVSTTFSYYRTGVKITITGSKTVVLPAATATTTMYFIYIDANDGTLTQSTSPWTLNDTKVLVATVTRNSGLTPTYLVSEERHSCKWSRRDHMYEHYTSGTQYSAGGALTGPTVASSVNANKTCAIATATFFDEDIYETTSAIAAGNATTDLFYTIFYRTAVGAWAWQKSLVPFKYLTTGAIQYDLNGVMTAAGAGGGGATRYVNYYLAVTNVSGQESWAWIPGRAAFTTAALAYAESFSSFSMTGFPCAEIVAIWQFTWDTNGTGLGLCRLNRTPVRINSNIITSTAVTAGSHNGLAGLDGGTAGEYYHATLAEYTGTGTGPFVRQTSPALTTPDLGDATATTINKVTVTAPATGATLTLADGSTLSASGTASISGTNTGDNAVNSNYSTLVSNATHTGDVTGSTALTLATVTQGATGTSFVKIALDTKGRVTSNVAVAQADITGLLGSGSISNTMLANAAVANLSGTNTGDLVSGTTIKTVNNTSLLGSGNLVVSGLVPTAIKTSVYTIVANDLVRVNSTSAAFTITLPASPTDGDQVGIIDVAGTCGANPVLVACAGGKTLEGDSTGLSVNINSAAVRLVYNSTGTNWKIVETPVSSDATNLTNTIAPQTIAATSKTTLVDTDRIPLVDSVLKALTWANLKANILTWLNTISYVIKTTTYTAAVSDMLYCNTTSAAFTVTLPPTPSAGNMVTIASGPAAGTNTLTIARNSSTIMGLSEDMTINENNIRVQFLYDGSTWRTIV